MHLPSLKKFLFALLPVLGTLSASAHITYGGRDFGTFDPGTPSTNTITGQTVSTQFGWADGTDADWGDSHRLRAFRFHLNAAGYVTIKFTGVAGGTGAGLLLPGFSVYSGLAHVAPAAPDHDFGTISQAWLASRFGFKEALFNALGDWKIGNDDGTTFADLSTFTFYGYAVDGTAVNFGSTPGLVGDGKADNTVTGTFFLPAGDYSILVGGAQYDAQPNPSVVDPGTGINRVYTDTYGVTGTVSISATNPAGIATFSAASYTAATGASGVNVTINRSAGGAAFDVDLATSNGTAIAGTDYTTTTTTVSFGPNATSKTVNIPLLTPPGVAASKSFTVALSNPTGGAAVAGYASATVNVIPSDATPPSVTIKTPLLNASINAPAVAVVSGTASDNKGLSKVELSLNSSTFAPATLSSGTWSSPVTPLPGYNTVIARSVDLSGNVSPIAFTAFTYVVKSALVATVNAADAAKGSVTGLLAGAAYQEGKSYSLTAVAKVGFYFDHWSANQGDLVGADQPKVSFIMSHGLQLTAFFVANPYLSAAGSYNGLISAAGATPATNATTGFITLTVTNLGAVGTGSVKMDGLSLPLGVVSFTSAGDALFGAAKTSSLTLTRAGKPGLVLTLHIEVAPGTAGANKLTGTLTEVGSGNASSINADRAYYNGNTLKPTALLNKPTGGFYTITLPAKVAPNNSYLATQYPQGDGHGSLTISTAGAVALSVTLADGSVVTASAPLSFANKVPVFASLYSGKGSVSGQLVFDTVPADSDVTGTGFHWFRPLSVSATPVYTAGWPNGITVDALGAKYDITKNVATSLGLTGNGVLTFSDGKLENAVTKNNFALTPANGVTKADASFTLVLVQSTGKFNGVFTHDSQTLKPAYTGVILQKGINAGGYGFFLSAPTNGQSGGVSLSK